MTDAAIQIVLYRLKHRPLPEENSHQVAYQVGWLEALRAVSEALAPPPASLVPLDAHDVPARPGASARRA